MTHDVVIRNGLIVDGLMNSAYQGDVAIDGDTISALGKVDRKGRREVNAEGAVVTPGFIDLHTHMDAQIGWDPRLRPHHGTGSLQSSWETAAFLLPPCEPKTKNC